MPTRVLVVALLSLSVASCAETVVDVDSPDTSLGNGAPNEGDGRSTTLPLDGTTGELLAEMSAEMSQLSAQISESGDIETFARIEAIWVVARPQVERTRPELVGGIDTSVEMARTAVVRVRPADADKAFSILSDLVDRYTGDG